MRVWLCFAHLAFIPHLVGGSVTIQAENFVDQRDGQQEDDADKQRHMRVSSLKYMPIKTQTRNAIVSQFAHGNIRNEKG